MAFQSAFSQNDKLNRCLVNDTDHIGMLTSPAADRSGTHVVLIQKALNAFANKAGVPSIRETGIYDQATADLVTTYKKVHQPPILNFKGQIDSIVGKKTVDALDKELPRLGVVPNKPDPAINPLEKQRVETLLAQHRLILPVLITNAMRVLGQCKIALSLAKSSPFQAGQALRQNSLGIDGLSRHFHISGNNLSEIDKVLNNYAKLLLNLNRLPIDQVATDYPTFLRDNPELALNKDGTPAKVPAFSDRQLNKMFYNPIYRIVSGEKEPFGGLAPIALQGIQIHEMCHFYLNMDDGDPSISTTARCLQLAQSYQRFVMQLVLKRPFP